MTAIRSNTSVYRRMCRQFVNTLERLVNPEIPVFLFAMKELKKAMAMLPSVF